MFRLFKWILGLVLGLVLLLVAAVAVIVLFVDPEDYKPQIVQAVEQATGRDFTIEGPLRLQFFPALALQVEGASLGNAPGFEGQDFAQIAALRLQVALQPLLSQRLEIDTVVVDGLTLNLARDAGGRTNWDDLLASDAADAADAPADDRPPAADADDPAAAGGLPLALSVQGLELTNGQVRWRDDSNGQQLTLSAVELLTGRLALGEVVPVQFAVTVSDLVPEQRLQITLSGDAQVDEGLRAQVDGLDLRLQASGAGLPERGAEARLQTDLVFDNGAQTLALEGLTIDLAGLMLSGELQGRQLAADPLLDGSLQLAELDLRAWLAGLGIPLDTADPAALTRVAAQWELSYGQERLALEPLRLQLDETTVTGFTRIRPSAGNATTAVLEVDRIDLARYLPPATEGAPGAEAPAPADAPSAETDPLAALHGLDLDIRLKVQELLHGDISAADVVAHLVVRDGVARLDPMQADLYDGTLRGKAMINATQSPPQLQLTQDLRGIQIGPLLQALAGEDRLLGKGEVSLDLQAAGLDQASLTRTLDGTASMAFRDGAFKGINLAELIRRAKAALGAESAPADEAVQTDFSELTASARIRQGVVDNQDLSLKSPLLRVTGQGQVDLPQEQIDYTLTTTIVQTLEGQGGKDLEELKGIPIPVRLTGNLMSPSPKVDLESILKARAKAELEKEREKLEQKAREKIQEEVGDQLQESLGDQLKGPLGDQLKGLFGR